MTPTRVLPMFPLGTVLIPGAPLPLHVFEPRYRSLVQDCLAGEPEFGVVLIERGSEVGGGDQRFAVGTLARITQVGESPDGRYVLTVVGVRRLRCVEWLPDAPYPLARVEFPEDGEIAADAVARRDTASRRLRRLLALHAELGDPVPSIDHELPADPITAVWAALVAAPLEVIDRQRVLEVDDPAARLSFLVDLLDAAVDAATARLGAGGP